MRATAGPNSSSTPAVTTSRTADGSFVAPGHGWRSSTALRPAIFITRTSSPLATTPSRSTSKRSFKPAHDESRCGIASLRGRKGIDRELGSRRRPAAFVRRIREWRSCGRRCRLGMAVRHKAGLEPHQLRRDAAVDGPGNRKSADEPAPYRYGSPRRSGRAHRGLHFGFSRVRDVPIAQRLGNSSTVSQGYPSAKSSGPPSSIPC